MKNVLFSLVSLLFFIGCATKYPHLTTTNKVDLERYQGKWYEIARFEHFFEKGCKNVTATYTLQPNQKVQVINQCMQIKDNSTTKATGVAYANNATNTQLKVSFFWPFYGDYWIIELDKNYQYALVGSPSREYLWILSRNKTITKNVKEKLLTKAKNQGFDTSKFIWTIQE